MGNEVVHGSVLACMNPLSEGMHRCQLLPCAVQICALLSFSPFIIIRVTFPCLVEGVDPCDPMHSRIQPPSPCIQAPALSPRNLILCWHLHVSHSMLVKPKTNWESICWVLVKGEQKFPRSVVSSRPASSPLQERPTWLCFSHSFPLPLFIFSAENWRAGWECETSLLIKLICAKSQ